MSRRLSVGEAIERLQASARAFANDGKNGPLLTAAIQYAAAKKRRNDSRDAWKIKHRLDSD